MRLPAFISIPHSSPSSSICSMDSSMPGQKICPHSGQVAGDDTSSFHTTTSSHESSTNPTSHNPESPSCPVVFMQEVDPVLLKTSLEDRIAYLTDFLNFTAHDAAVIKQIAPVVNDIIPGMVDDLYSKFFEFDITKQVFMTRNQVGDTRVDALYLMPGRFTLSILCRASKVHYLPS